MKKVYFFVFLVLQVLIHPMVYSQKPASFVQDSLLARKFHSDGVAAGRLGNYEGAITHFKEVYRIYKNPNHPNNRYSYCSNPFEFTSRSC